MEELLMALATSLAESGPIWLLSFTGIVMFVWKIWPHIAELSRRRDEREDRRERRMEEYQKEQAERDGKWLIVSEQSARAMESMTEQMKVNNALLQDSKQRSAGMGTKIDDIDKKVNEIHTIAVRSKSL